MNEAVVGSNNNKYGRKNNNSNRKTSCKINVNETKWIKVIIAMNIERGNFFFAVSSDAYKPKIVFDKKNKMKADRKNSSQIQIELVSEYICGLHKSYQWDPLWIKTNIFHAFYWLERFNDDCFRRCD